MYLIAVLCRAFTTDGQFNLHLYDSERFTRGKGVLYTYSSKVIAIGGEHGSVGWVDLWYGILVCDLLRDSNHLRYIPLPPPIVPKLSKGPPLRVRDISVLEKEYIKYFDMQLCSIGPGLATEGWEAATWRRKVSSTEWEEGCRIKVPSDPAFPKLQEDESTRPILKGIYSGFPALSLHDDDAVYIMDKHDLLDRKASVIAVDMRNQTLKGVADFGSGRPLGYSFVYFQSAISKYLGRWSSTPPDFQVPTTVSVVPPVKTFPVSVKQCKMCTNTATVCSGT